MIEVRNLKKTYGKKTATVRALRGVSFRVKRGDFISIMGASGSGKSTLMNILGCLDRQTSGEYYLNGIDVRNLSKDRTSDLRNTGIGFVFQSFFLLPRLTALQNLELPMAYMGMSPLARRKRALKILNIMGLSDRGKHYPSELSGGQKQRIAIGRALANNPYLILADEPTGNLDSETSRDIMRVLKKLNDNGTTIVLITHEKEIAEYTDRVLVLRDGLFINHHEFKKERAL